MCLSTLGFLMGILICQTLSELPDLRWFFLIIPLVLLVRIFPILRVLLFLALGFFWTAWRADMILTQELPLVLERQEIILTGKIVDLPYYQDKRWRFDVIPSQLIFNGKSQLIPGKVRLTWENDQYPLRPGQQWQFTVRLKRPHSTLNPNSADYSAKLFQQRIRATGNVRKKGPNRLLAETSGFNVDLLRYRLGQIFKQEFRNNPSVGILMALTIGDGSEISPTQWEIFRQTGTTHLVVISGLHISIVASFTYLFSSWLWRRLGVTALWLPAPYFAIPMSVSFAFFYTLLAGASIPTQRAFVMVAVGIVSILSGRIALLHKLLLALLLVLIYDPFAVMMTGFWLSFGTITIIIYVLNGSSTDSSQNSQLLQDKTLLESSKLWIQFRLRTLRNAISAFFKIQIAISLCLIPVLLMIYANIFPASFVANFIAIPIVSLIVTPMIFLGTLMFFLSHEWGYLFLSEALDIFDGTFDLLVAYVLSDTTRYTWQPFVPSLWATIIAVAGIILLLLPRGFPGRWLGLIGLLPLFFSPATQPLQSKEVEFTLLDVGQGLASVIRTQHHTLVYDTGPKHDRFDTGQAIVLPFLRSQRVQQIDTLIVSHLENDHYGGSITLLKNFIVKEVLTNFPQKARSLGITPTQPCQLGQQWQWDGVEFEILHPPSNYTANANDSSCVLKVSVGKYALLLPGDVGKLIEYRLVQQHQQHLQSDILVAPHHGSRYSSSEVFIEAVKPKLVLFSSGYRNNFNHPHPQTQKRYQSRGIRLLRTDFTGAITLRFSGSHELGSDDKIV